MFPAAAKGTVQDTHEPHVRPLRPPEPTTQRLRGYFRRARAGEFPQPPPPRNPPAASAPTVQAGTPRDKRRGRGGTNPVTAAAISPLQLGSGQVMKEGCSGVGGRALHCGAAYTTRRHLPLAFAWGGLAWPHRPGGHGVAGVDHRLPRRPPVFRPGTCTRTANAAAAAAAAHATSAALSSGPPTSTATNAFGVPSQSSPPSLSLSSGVPVTMAAKKTDVIALFDVDGTLTKPRLVCCWPHAKR